MGVIVKKFGGTSVANPESRKFVYKKIIDEIERGNKLVIVISAMGRCGDPYATDTLLDLVRIDNPNTTPRELDHIFVCGENISGVVITSSLQLLGYKTMYLTGLQAGIITDNNHQDSRIINIETTKIKRLLEEGYIVVVGGGQGSTLDGEITTLGRGGSDTSACALGVALDADGIEIYTDVEGVLTTDPRITQDARIIDQITYEDCIELAYQGAKVIHPRAVEAAQKNTNIPFYIRSTFSDSIGTLICSKDIIKSQGLNTRVPIGVTLLDNQLVIEIDDTTIENKIPIEYSILNARNSKCILIDTANHNAYQIIAEVESLTMNYKLVDKLSKLTIVGTDLRENIIELCLNKLEDNKIEPLAYKVDKNSISIWVREDKRVEALIAAHSLILEYNQSNESLVEVV